jgi:hypothetical protein
MHSQQKAESDLLVVYRNAIVMVLILSLFAVLGWAYFSSVSDIRGQSLAVEHNRLVTSLPMIRSQWLSSGRPQQMRLQWQSAASNLAKTGVDARLTEPLLMTHTGWPRLSSLDVLGCKKLWQQLLGSDLNQMQLTVKYQKDTQTCSFVTSDGSSLNYQQTAGKVTFLTNR